MYIKYVANSILLDNTHSTFKPLENKIDGSYNFQAKQPMAKDSVDLILKIIKRLLPSHDL